MAKRSRARAAIALVGIGAIAGSWACNAVLGISVASVDPTLADAGTTDDAPPENPYTCKSYCEAIAKNCTETNQEYTTIATCNAICSHFEPGVAGEQVNDSLACRVFHTQQAATDPKGHCQQAGPLAAGTCAANPCSAFCSLSFDLCNPASVWPYRSPPECRASCETWPYLKTTDPDGGMVGDILFASGNSLNCRLYHLESAYEVDNPNAKTTHCPHIGDPSATCN